MLLLCRGVWFIVFLSDGCVFGYIFCLLCQHYSDNFSSSSFFLLVLHIHVYVYIYILLFWKSLSSIWLCNPMDYRVHGILQARTLEWVADPFSRGSSQPRDCTQVSPLKTDSLPAEPPGKPIYIYGGGGLVTQSCPTLLWPHGISQARILDRAFPSPGDLPDPGIKPGSLHCRQILYLLSHQWSPNIYL